MIRSSSLRLQGSKFLHVQGTHSQHDFSESICDQLLKCYIVKLQQESLISPLDRSQVLLILQITFEFMFLWLSNFISTVKHNDQSDIQAKQIVDRLTLVCTAMYKHHQGSKTAFFIVQYFSKSKAKQKSTLKCRRKSDILDQEGCRIIIPCLSTTAHTKTFRHPKAKNEITWKIFKLTITNHIRNTYRMCSKERSSALNFMQRGSIRSLVLCPIK